MKISTMLKVAVAAVSVIAVSSATLTAPATASGTIDTYGSCGLRSVKFNLSGAGAVNAVCAGGSFLAYWGQNGCPDAGASDAFRDAMAEAIDYRDRVDLQFSTASNGNTCLYSVTKKP